VIRIRLILTALGLSFVALLVLTPPATADNCDIFINPEDCQNTGWTIGVIATLAGGVAVATAATAAGGKEGGGERRKPTAPLSPAGPWMTSSARRERCWTIEEVEIRLTSDPPSITIQPPNGVVHGHSVTLETHSDSGWQTVQEVDRGHE
jgi:hypothetical protein